MKYKILFSLLAGCISQRQPQDFCSAQQSIDCTLAAVTEIRHLLDAENQTHTFESLGFLLIIAIVLAYINPGKHTQMRCVSTIRGNLFRVSPVLVAALLAIVLTTNRLAVFSSRGA